MSKTALKSDVSWIDDPSVTAEVASDLEVEHRARNAYNKAQLRQYFDRGVEEDGVNWARVKDLDVYKDMRRMGYNLTREVADGSASSVCRPLCARLDPVGLDAMIDRQCQAMNRLLDGVFDMVKFKAVAKRAYRDCQKTDIGALMWSVTEDEFRCERLNPLYVLWPMDDQDEPRTLMYVDSVPKANLKARYPEKAAEIDKLPPFQHDRIFGVHAGSSRRRRGENVKLVTAYATTMGNSKGKYVLACDNGLVLEDSEWDYPLHPIVVCRWDWDFDGFGGVSLARVLTPYHVRVQRNKRKEDAMLAGAKPAIIAPESCAQDAKWSDEAYQQIIYPDGATPPQVIMPSVVSPELIQSTDRDYIRARAEGGVSESISTGQAPTAITSGRGLREAVGISDLRQSDQFDVWGGLHTDSARVVVMLGHMYKGKIRAKVRARGADWLMELKWMGPQELKDSQYVIKFGLVSALPQTIAGKLDTLEDLGKLGLATQADMARLSEMPDVQRLSDALNGPLDLAENIIDLAIVGDEKGVPQFIPVMALPTPDLQAMHTRALQRLQSAAIPAKQTPPANMECLRKLIRNIEARLKAAAPPPMPAMPGAPPGASPGAPGVPPMPVPSAPMAVAG